MQLSSFAGCCGIHIVNGLGHTITNPSGGEPEIDEVRDELEYYERNAFYDKGLVLVALNEEQQQVYKKLMKEFELEPIVKDFYHPGHGNFITLYGRRLYDDNRKKVLRKKEAEKKAAAPKPAVKRTGTRATFW